MLQEKRCLWRKVQWVPGDKGELGSGNREFLEYPDGKEFPHKPETWTEIYLGKQGNIQRRMWTIPRGRKQSQLVRSVRGWTKVGLSVEVHNFMPVFPGLAHCPLIFCRQRHWLRMKTKGVGWVTQKCNSHGHFLPLNDSWCFLHFRVLWMFHLRQFLYFYLQIPISAVSRVPRRDPNGECQFGRCPNWVVKNLNEGLRCLGNAWI